MCAVTGQPGDVCAAGGHGAGGLAARQPTLQRVQVLLHLTSYFVIQWVIHPCPKEVSNTFALNCNHVDDRNIYHVYIIF